MRKFIIKKIQKQLFLFKNQIFFHFKLFCEYKIIAELITNKAKKYAGGKANFPNHIASKKPTIKKLAANPNEKAGYEGILLYIRYKVIGIDKLTITCTIVHKYGF